MSALLAPALLAALASCGGSHEADEGRIVDPASLPGQVMDFATAQNFFPPLKRPTSRMMWDEDAWVVLRPDRTQSFDWAEHPAGRITFRTNNLGFREDAPTAPVKSGPRILVTGDSQTEGAVNNAESWPNALERLLAASRATASASPGPHTDAATRSEPATSAGAASADVEVLNAGVGGTGPHNFLGVLRRNLRLAPDVFIAALYAGNDFQGALQVNDFFAKRHAAPRSAEYTSRLDAANARWPDALPQGFNQAAYFAFAPDDAAVALDAVVSVYAAIDVLCREHGIRFVAVVIPIKADVEPDDDRATVDAILDALSLTREQLGIDARLGRQFADAMRERGIPCVDALDGMRGAAVPLYWRKDHHLDIAGNERLAAVVREPLEVLLASPAAPPGAPQPQPAPTPTTTPAPESPSDAVRR